MDEGSAPSLEVGFVIDTRGSFGSLIQLDGQIDSTVANAVGEFQRVNQASKGMLDLSAAKANISSFGNATTREAAASARELNKVEKSGEALSRQLERQAATFGKTAQEIRRAKVETAALAAEQQGLTELAGRLRAQEDALYAEEFAAARRARQEAEDAAEAKAMAAARAAAAAEAEAEAVRRAAGAYHMFEAVARQRMAAYRQQQAEEAATARSTADLATRADRLRASIDPSAAAQQRFNREMAEARLLISAGAISLDDYVAKLRLEQAALDASKQAQNAHGASIGNARMAMAGASYQIQDLFTQISMGQNAINAFVVNGAQLAGQFSTIEGKAGNVARFFMGPWGLAITAGLMVLSPFLWKLLQMNNELDESVKKQRENARQTELTRLATEAYNRTIDGMIERTRELNQELREQIRTQQQIQAQQLEGAMREEQRHRTHLTNLRNELRQVEQELARTRNMPRPAVTGEQIGAALPEALAARLEERARSLRQEIQRVSESAVAAAEDVRLAQAPLLDRGVEASLDARTAAVERFEEALARLRNQLRIGPGRSEWINVMRSDGTQYRAHVEGISDAEYSRLRRLASERKEREVRQAEEAERAARATNRDLVRPVTGAVLSPFGADRSGVPLNGRLVQRRHEGVDLVGRIGDPVLAPQGGTAHVRNAPGGLGLYVEIRADNGARELLGHLSAARVTDGQRVEAGQLVGLVGNSGNARGGIPHLHWQHRERGGGWIDPMRRVGSSGAAQAETREAREARQREEEERAVQAQIANLYDLARAYEATGGAAMIAAARVKAESDAIRDGGDVEARVAREVNLQIAQRVANAAQSTAAMREQASVQAAVNAQVAAGIVPASQAADLVRDQMADLPLLAAIQAATASNNVEAAQRATDALEAQREARRQLTAAEREAAFQATMENGATRLAELREELRLVGAAQTVRERALVTLRATEEARRQQLDPTQAAAYIAQQLEIFDTTQRIADAQRNWNDALSETADRWDLISQNVQGAASGLAEAFGPAGAAIGDIASRYADYHAQRARMDLEHRRAITEAAGNETAIARENARHALQTATSQVALYGDMASAAKGFFKEGTAGYRAMAAAEKAFRAIQFALSVRAMAQDIAETASAVANSVFRAGKYAAEAVAKAISSLPFPANLAAGAATAAALAAIGISVVGSFGGGKKAEKPNEGTGTVLGDPEAKSESIKRAIDALKEVDTLTLAASREMAASLRSIDRQLGGVASQVVRAGDINASVGVKEGFNPNLLGSVLGATLGAIPLIGGLFKGLFGSTTKVTASGLYAGSQSLGSILDGGFQAEYFSDIQKKSKLFGITTGTKNSTKYTGADAALETQFALLLRSFNDAITAAAGPLGHSLNDVQNKLLGFTFSLGKIDLQGLTGEEIEEKLAAVFGAAADKMALAAVPGIDRFQRVGEGAFETLVRVASAVETVTASLGRFGGGVAALSIDAKMAIVDQFDSLSDMVKASDAFFERYYTKEEQTAARAAQFNQAFSSLGLTMPSTLAGFRALVEAQDLTTAAGRETYATLLQLAPAFADLQAAMEGAKSAADIAAERADLERQILQLRGDTAALRALDLAKLDASNRALQQQVWALQDAQDAAKAADELRKAWTSVGDSIMDEVRRIRGLNDAAGGGSFATLMGRFNATTAAARAGDMEAAKALPQLSQALLTAAQNAATSRQELDRVRAQTAASLEATFGAIGALSSAATASATTNAALLGAAGTSQAANSAGNDNNTDRLAAKLDELRAELERMRSESNAALTVVAGNTGRTARKLEDVTAASGGDAVSTRAAA